ncbi:hypothetical protein D9M68_926400 [compost metagenome]
MDAITGPLVLASCSVTKAVRGFSVGCSRFQRSTSWPSRVSSLKLGQLQMPAATPQSFSSSSCAANASRRMVPLPNSCTLGASFLSAGAGLHRYMPLMICSSVPGGRPGMG